MEKYPTHVVYTQAEADILGLHYVTPESVTPNSEWVLTRDGRVVRVVNVVYDGLSLQVRTPVGIFFKRMDGTRRVKWDFGNLDAFLKREYAKRRDHRYMYTLALLMWVNGMSLDRAISEATGRRIKSKKSARATLRNLFDRKLAWEALLDVIERVLETAGVTKDWIISEMKRLYRDTGADRLKFEILKEFLNMHKELEKSRGMLPTTAFNDVERRLKEAEDVTFRSLPSADANGAEDLLDRGEKQENHKGSGPELHAETLGRGEHETATLGATEGAL